MTWISLTSPHLTSRADIPWATAGAEPWARSSHHVGIAYQDIFKLRNDRPDPQATFRIVGG